MYGESKFVVCGVDSVGVVWGMGINHLLSQLCDFLFRRELLRLVQPCDVLVPEMAKYVRRDRNRNLDAEHETHVRPVEVISSLKRQSRDRLSAFSPAAGRVGRRTC